MRWYWSIGSAWNGNSKDYSWTGNTAEEEQNFKAIQYQAIFRKNFKLPYTWNEFALRITHFIFFFINRMTESRKLWTVNNERIYSIHRTPYQWYHTMRRRKRTVKHGLPCVPAYAVVVCLYHITSHTDANAFYSTLSNMLCNSFCTPNTNTWTELEIVKNFQHPNSHNTIYGAA